jgi:hypothetical protein
VGQKHRWKKLAVNSLTASFFIFLIVLKINQPRAIPVLCQVGHIQADAEICLHGGEVANRFNVSGMPQTTINGEGGTVVGAAPEANVLAEIQRVMA